MKLLFVTDSFEQGGITSSLLALVDELHKLGNDIDILTFLSEEPEVDIPPYVTLISPCPFIRACFDLPKTHVRRGRYVMAGVAAFSRIMCKVLTNVPVLAFEFLFQPGIGPYDVAIAYRQEMGLKRQISGFVRFVTSRCVKAKSKIGFIHCDCDALGYRAKTYERMYNRLDQIVCVSEETMRSFQSALPGVRVPVSYVYNCHDYDRIGREALEDVVVYDKRSFNVVSVSRLSKEKANERILYAVKYCLSKGADVHYHVVGDGKQKEYLLKLADELGVADRVTFYGAKRNPYPYIKAADLLMISSLHEAAPMVIGEAAVLGVPVLTTRTCSAKELVSDHGIGWVCGQEQDEINETLYGLAMKPEMVREVAEELKGMTFDNSESVEKFREIVEKLKKP